MIYWGPLLSAFVETNRFMMGNSRRSTLALNLFADRDMTNFNDNKIVVFFLAIVHVFLLNWL